MKDKKELAFFLTLALCAVLLIVLYMYLYQPYTQKTETLRSSNQTLTTRVNQLSQFYAQMPENKRKIESMTEEINEILERFPADVLEEDVMYLALRTQSEGNNVRYTSIGVDKRAELGVIPAATVTDANVEGLDRELTFLKRGAVYNNDTGYLSLKSMLASLNGNEEEMSIDKVVYVYDADSATLKGTINVTFYTVDGTGKEYKPRTFMDYESLGSRNLFTAQTKAEE